MAKKAVKYNCDDWVIYPGMDIIMMDVVQQRRNELIEEFGERDMDEDEMRELNCLSQLVSFADSYHDDTLIRDSYFNEYAQELADEMGVIPANYVWPTNCIDWDKAARELQSDYVEVDFAGTTYWMR